MKKRIAFSLIFLLLFLLSTGCTMSRNYVEPQSASNVPPATAEVGGKEFDYFDGTRTTGCTVGFGYDTNGAPIFGEVCITPSETREFFGLWGCTGNVCTANYVTTKENFLAQRWEGTLTFTCVDTGCTEISDNKGNVYTFSKTIETASQTPASQTLPFKTFAVGESTSDGNVKVTVNKAIFTSASGSEYVGPDAGYQYLVIDLSVQNLQSDKVQTIFPMYQCEVTDQDGFNYNIDIATAYYDRGWKGSDILPASIRRGNLLFQVPKNAKSFQFHYKFDLYGGTIAVFRI